MAEEVRFVEEETRREVVEELEEIGDTLKILDLADWPEISEKIDSAIVRLTDLKPPPDLLDKVRSEDRG